MVQNKVGDPQEQLFDISEPTKTKKKRKRKLKKLVDQVDVSFESKVEQEELLDMIDVDGDQLIVEFIQKLEK